MSFVRLGKSHSSTSFCRRKKTGRKKPVWDDTVHDLTGMKASPDEVAYRKMLHKSTNAVKVRLEKQRVGAGHAKDKDGSKTGFDARKLAVMKEVLYDQQQFQHVLSKTDQMMGVVKDLFGDDPKRFTGFPHVTAAPHADDPNCTDSLVAPLPEITTRMQMLSDSIMDGSALNDMPESDSATDEEGNGPEPISYQPKLNMQRFQQFLAAEEKNQSLSTISGHAQISQNMTGPVQSTQLPGSLQTTHEGDGDMLHTPKRGHNESIPLLRTPKSAINDTRKVKKTKRRAPPASASSQQNTSALNLTDLRKVLGGLEDEIAEYERQTGRRQAVENQRQESFSGYTVALVDGVTKLTRYLKESELRLRAEVTVREHLTQDVMQLKALIDALTSDIIVNQEEYAKLTTDFSRYRKETEAEMFHLKTVLQEVGILSGVELKRTEQHPVTTPPRQMLPTRHEVPRETIMAIPGNIQPCPSAVMLSPVVRKTRIHENEEQQPQTNLRKQTSLIDVANLAEGSPKQTQIPRSQSMFHDRMVENPAGVEGEFKLAYPEPHRHPQLDEYQTPAIPPGAHYIPGDAGLPHPHSVPVYSEGQNHSGNIDGQRVPFSVQSQGQGFSLYSHTQAGLGPQMSSVDANQRVVQTDLSAHVPYSVATINVPRPTPLVQSNVGIPIKNSETRSAFERQSVINLQGQNSGFIAPPGGPSQKPVRDNSVERDVLSSQIADLNRQHEEAQKRLQTLLQQQQQKQQQDTNSNSARPGQDSPDAEPHWQMAPLTQPQQQVSRAAPPPGLPSYPVSPPISPISQRSDNYLGFPERRDLNGSTRITVSIPRMDLDMSAGSSPSPQHQRVTKVQ